MSIVKGPLLYHIVRLLRPQTIIETGVASGVPSCFILKALEENGRGTLVSIDLPDADPLAGIPPEQDAGWLVPHQLRQRWKLELGDSRLPLPKALSRCDEVDIFIHDSRHTYEHMTWEFETAWPFIRDGGLLASDDINFNDAFESFCSRRKLRITAILGFGIVQKSR